MLKEASQSGMSGIFMSHVSWLKVITFFFDPTKKSNVKGFVGNLLSVCKISSLGLRKAGQTD